MVSDRNAVARSIHDLSLAAWFGGSLMGAVGLSAAGKQINDPSERLAALDAGWKRWQPVSQAAIGLHVASALRITQANRTRLIAQRGVGSVATFKTAVTGLAIGATVYASVLGKRAKKRDGGQETDLSGRSATERRLLMVQWAVPALTGTLLVLNAVMGEQQRPMQVLRGVARNRGVVAAALRALAR